MLRGARLFRPALLVYAANAETSGGEVQVTKAWFRITALLSSRQLSQATWFKQIEDEPLFAARYVLELLIRADARGPR